MLTFFAKQKKMITFVAFVLLTFRITVVHQILVLSV